LFEQLRTQGAAFSRADPCEQQALTESRERDTVGIDQL